MYVTTDLDSVLHRKLPSLLSEGKAQDLHFLQKQEIWTLCNVIGIPCAIWGSISDVISAHSGSFQHASNTLIQRVFLSSKNRTTRKKDTPFKWRPNMRKPRRGSQGTAQVTVWKCRAKNLLLGKHWAGEGSPRKGQNNQYRVEEIVITTSTQTRKCRHCSKWFSSTNSSSPYNSRVCAVGFPIFKKRQWRIWRLSPLLKAAHYEHRNWDEFQGWGLSVG